MGTAVGHVWTMFFKVAQTLVDTLRLPTAHRGGLFSGNAALARVRQVTNESEEALQRCQIRSRPLSHPAPRAQDSHGVSSGGEQQMLTICRSLLGNPLVLMVDKPTEGWRRASSKSL